jgi:hypothetical protein
MKRIKTLIITGEIKTVQPGVRQSDLTARIDKEVNAALALFRTDEVDVNVQINFPTPSSGGSALVVLSASSKHAPAEDEPEEEPIAKGKTSKKKNQEGAE